MKPILRTIKFISSIALQLIVTIAVFIVGWSMSTTSINLNASSKTVGTVSSIGPRYTNAGKAGKVYSLIIFLAGEDIGYCIYRSGGDYQVFIDAIKPGTQVTIYHSAVLASNNYFTVYQLQNSVGILYSKDEYERKEKLAGRFLALPGGIALLAIIGFQIRKRIKERALNIRTD